MCVSVLCPTHARRSDQAQRRTLCCYMFGAVRYLRNAHSKCISCNNNPNAHAPPALMNAFYLVQIPEGEGGHFTVCGDTHGQFYDVLNIFKLNGLPSAQNPYLFNGDFVDRSVSSLQSISRDGPFPSHQSVLAG